LSLTNAYFEEFEMNLITKTLISLISLSLLVGLAACSFNGVMTLNEEKTADAAVKIADFDLPEGYQADFSAAWKGYRLVAFNPGDDRSHLYVVQSERESDRERLEEMLGRLVPGDVDWQSRSEVLETRSVLVQGKLTTMVVKRGLNSEKQTYLQAVVPFDGKGGPALLVFSQPENRWNETVLEALVASIK
jgi:hypothetical protein